MIASECILPVASIRTDGGTQVRETLDQGWVDELVAFYQEGHVIPPVSVVLDNAGNYWLSDGFHRVRARLNAGLNDINALVSTGTVDDAKLAAAASNKSGRARSDGDKRRAILMAKKTAVGASMGVRELARHVGVSKSWAQEVLEECPAPDTGHELQLQSAPRPSVRALWARVDAAVTADPSKPIAHVARDLGCGDDVVRRRRQALGLPPSSPGVIQKARGEAARGKLRSLLAERPNITVREASAVAGCSQKIVDDVRRELGVGRRAPGPPPSAPPRKGGDVRDKADVIPQRPAPGVDSKVTEAIRFIERLSDAERETLQAALAKRWPATFAIAAPESPKSKAPRASGVAPTSRAVWAEVRSLLTNHVEAELGHLDEPERHRLVGRFSADIKAVLSDVSSVLVRQRKSVGGLGEMRASASFAEVCRACDALGVKKPKRHQPVDQEAARRERKRLLRTYHPDSNGGNDATRAQFDAVNDAYRVVEGYNEEIGNAQSAVQSNGVAHV